jgi:hypothetical protein
MLSAAGSSLKGRGSSRHSSRRPLRLILVAFLAAASAQCATRLPARPSGTPTDAPDAVDLFEKATAHCAGLKTLTAELGLSGHAGDERLRGRIIAGLRAGGDARLEGVAPFGPPVFILVSESEKATLLLPRDQRVLSSTTVSAVLERLTGLALGADDLRAALTACFGAGLKASEGRQWPGGWRSVRAGTDLVVFLRERGGVWAVTAVDAGAWRADYADVLNAYPRTVRLRSSDDRVDLTARMQQLEVNTAIEPAAFQVSIPADAAPLTLDELRNVAPLRTTQP